ncbi:SitI3 family protein [Micromonospora sp. SH-82]|uniref:SitI3 family protein n=1 Tax=Micromonospora sp. SH-82 TaxID=3132938 RepID=UPI003EB859D1
MGIDYRLTLAGDIPLEQVAALVVPDGFRDSTGAGGPRLLTADLTTQRGFSVSVFAGSHGYLDAEGDDGTHWEWEPDRYVNVIFDMVKNDQPDTATAAMVAAVARVLADRPEDAALVLGNNWLLLTRTADRLRTHRPQWWDNYGLAETFTHS